MKERPILFSGPMVRAILAGDKTQTRRPIKPAHTAINYNPPVFSPAASVHPDGSGTGWIAWFPNAVTAEETKKLYPGADGFKCPYGQPGDHLWVKETWFGTGTGDVFYRADGKELNEAWSWRPSIHMPRWASRITLEIPNIRVERVQEISPEDCIYEGISIQPPSGVEQPKPTEYDTWTDEKKEAYIKSISRPVYMARLHYQEELVKAYSDLWDSINAKRGYGWDVNPWIWVIEFKRV